MLTASFKKVLKKSERIVYTLERVILSLLRVFVKMKPQPDLKENQMNLLLRKKHQIQRNLQRLMKADLARLIRKDQDRLNLTKSGINPKGCQMTNPLYLKTVNNAEKLWFLQDQQIKSDSDFVSILMYTIS